MTRFSLSILSSSDAPITPKMDPALPNVPWITSWSGENEFGVRPCRWAGGERAVWQRHAPGDGVPLWKKRHMVRARQAIARQLCGVCGQHVPPDDRWLVPIGRYEPIDGAVAYVLVEPASHRACLFHALALCPALPKIHGAQATGKPNPAKLLFRPPVHTWFAPSDVIQSEFGVSVPRESKTVTAMAEYLRKDTFAAIFPHGAYS
jgi:hypothetical protein